MSYDKSPEKVTFVTLDTGTEWGILRSFRERGAMYNYEFEGLILGGIEWEEYNALVAELNAEEAENDLFGNEYLAWVAENDNVDLDEMARYYGEDV